MLAKRNKRDDTSDGEDRQPNKKVLTKNPYTNIPYSQRFYKLLDQRSKLPAFKAHEQFLELLETDDIIVIKGETGSGKTTQIPQFLMGSKYVKEGQMVAITQPRRIAAISVAKRVAQETDTTLGEQVGYSVRFDDRTSKSTVLKYVTDGMLIRELISDRNLHHYSAILIDEAHERTINTDILLGVLKDLVRKRAKTNPLKLIIMSATIEIERFVNYFDKKAPVLTIPGRQHPVEVYYTPRPEEDYLSAAIKTSAQIHLYEDPGDILVFLTGEDEIEQAVTKIGYEISQHDEENKPVIILPLYGAMSSEAQQRVFDPAPAGSRKIIISTNIAETSVTIDGVVYVVDCGLAKQKVYNPRMKYESLLISPISKASAKQRAGRAGRTRPGKCYRLYTEESYKKELQDFSIAEILRSDLSSTVLQLKLLAINNIVKFDFIEPPAPETMFRALETLVHIGALDGDNGDLTLTGKTLGLFPLEPRMAKVLLKSKELGCTEEILNVVAMSNSGNWRIRPPEESALADSAHKTFYHEANCDLLTTHNVVKAYEDSKRSNEFCREYYLNGRNLNTCMNVKSQLKQILFNAKTVLDHGHEFQNQPTSVKVKICLLSGFYQQIAHLHKAGMYTVFGETHQVIIHPSSSVKPVHEFVLYLEFVLTSKNFIRNVSVMNGKWLVQLFPNIFNSENAKTTETKKAMETLERDMVNSKKRS